MAEPSSGGKIRYWELAPDLFFPEFVKAIGDAPGLEVHEETLKLVNEKYLVEADYHLDTKMISYRLIGIGLSVQKVDEDKSTDGRLWIDTDTFRSLRIAEIREGIGQAVGWPEKRLRPGDEAWSQLPYRKGGISDVGLEWAARVYAIGSVSGRSPQKDVSKELDVSIATAGRRIKSAITRGFLVPTTRVDEMLKNDEIARATHGAVRDRMEPQSIPTGKSLTDAEEG